MNKLVNRELNELDDDLKILSKMSTMVREDTLKKAEKLNHSLSVIEETKTLSPNRKERFKNRLEELSYDSINYLKDVSNKSLGIAAKWELEANFWQNFKYILAPDQVEKTYDNLQDLTNKLNAYKNEFEALVDSLSDLDDEEFMQELKNYRRSHGSGSADSNTDKESSATIGRRLPDGPPRTNTSAMNNSVGKNHGLTVSKTADVKTGWDIGVKIQGRIDKKFLTGKPITPDAGLGFGGADEIVNSYGKMGERANAKGRMFDLSKKELVNHSEAEIMSLTYFSSNRFRAFNSVIINGAESASAEYITQSEVIEASSMLDSALSKGSGEMKKLWRGISPNNEGVQKAGSIDKYVSKMFNPGELYHEEGYTSTSVEPGVALMHYSGPNNYESLNYSSEDPATGIMLEIVTPEGVNILSEAEALDEYEVLLPRDQHYQCLSKQRKGSIWVVQLIAVDPNTMEVRNQINQTSPTPIAERISGISKGTIADVKKYCPWIK